MSDEPEVASLADVRIRMLTPEELAKEFGDEFGQYGSALVLDDENLSRAVVLLGSEDDAVALGLDVPNAIVPPRRARLVDASMERSDLVDRLREIVEAGKLPKLPKLRELLDDLDSSSLQDEVAELRATAEVARNAAEQLSASADELEALADAAQAITDQTGQALSELDDAENCEDREDRAQARKALSDALESLLEYADALAEQCE